MASVEPLSVTVAPVDGDRADDHLGAFAKARIGQCDVIEQSTSRLRCLPYRLATAAVSSESVSINASFNFAMPRVMASVQPNTPRRISRGTPVFSRAVELGGSGWVTAADPACRPSRAIDGR